MNRLLRHFLPVLAAGLSLASTSPVWAQLNTRLVSQLPLGADSDTREVWVENQTAYVARGSKGLDIVDSSNPSAPVRISTILPFAHADISDVQVVNGIAYMANEIANGSPTPWVGLFIYDVRNPLAPVELGRLEWGAGGGYHLGCDAHSVTIEVTPTATNAYLSSGITGDLALFDVSNPALPVYLSEIYSPVWSYNSQAHDAVVAGGRCYTTWLGGGFTVHDVSNPTAPVLLAHVPSAGINSEFFYHAALSTNGQSLVVTGAKVSAPHYVKVWNISNLAAITLAGAFGSPSGAIPHQVTVAGKYAYIAHFGDGLRVLDISNPAAPVSVGWYDPDPSASAAGTAGAWGVFVAGNNVYLSHMTGGLYIVDFVDTITVTRADWRRRSNTLVIEATSTAAPSAGLTVVGRGAMTYNTGTGRYTFTQTGVTSMPSTVTINSDIGGTRTASVRRVNN